ncbi:MAG TPA: pitrilysin family protein [Longimicrobium sp.]|nr:pitrilysin family protein [Longimicrobium sp.]
MVAPPGGVCFPHEQHVLDNGLTVVMSPDPATPLVSVQVMYRVGSRHEPPGQTGFAHLLEHLFFEGSAHVPAGGHFRYVQETGGTPTGSTWHDCTTYQQTVPAGELDLALWLEADRMGFLEPALTAGALEVQRGVIRNERRENYEAPPYGTAADALLATAFPAGHPYAHSPIGLPQDLERATLDVVRGFYRRWYGPNNAVLVLCGGFHPAGALERVEHWFGELPPRPVPPAPAVPAPDADAERRARMTDRVRLPRVYHLYPAPAYARPGYEAADVLSLLLAQGPGSVLHRDLVQRRGLAVDVAAYTVPTEAVGLLYVTATARPGVTAEALAAGMDEALGAFLAQGPEDDDVLRAVNQSRLGLVGQLNSVARRSDAFAHAAALGGDPGYVNRALARYSAVDRAELESLARRLLRRERRTVLQVVPGAGKGAPEPV